jgi:hypothetical protein
VVLRLFLFDVIGLNSADFSIPLFSLTRVDPFMVDFECADFHSFVRLLLLPDGFLCTWKLQYIVLLCCCGHGRGNAWRHSVPPYIGETWHLKLYFKWFKVCEAVESPGGLQDCQGGVEGD